MPETKADSEQISLKEASQRRKEISNRMSQETKARRVGIFQEAIKNQAKLKEF